MGFFQDLKQDLSQTVNGLEPEDAVAELNLEEAEAFTRFVWHIKGG